MSASLASFAGSNNEDSNAEVHVQGSAYQDNSRDEANDLQGAQGSVITDSVQDREDMAPISMLCHQCLDGYQDLSENLRDTTHDDACERGFDRDEKLRIAQDSRLRFRAWAVNIAAHQKGHLRSSLDFRLKDATELRQRIIQILEGLLKSLENASLIVSGRERNRVWKVGYISDSGEEEVTDDEDDFPDTSELDQLLSTMNVTNTNLMKLSIIIRNSPSRDDYLKAASRYNFDPRYDIGHVKEKYGSAKRSKEWLQERLGKSITRRRQFLKYRQDHYGKLARDWETSVEDEKQPEKTIALTKATTYVESKALPQDVKDGSEAGSFGSQTSYDQTVMGEAAENKLTVPPPPKMAFEGIPFEYGESFECPYCYTVQIVKNKTAWKKHVFRDLRPYVCTFKGCNMRMFRSRNEWFAHELQNHRRQWLCVLCATPFASKTPFLVHLASAHRVSESDPQLPALVLQSEESVDSISAAACPLCDEWEEYILDPKRDSKGAFLNEGQNVKPYGTLKQFRRHLGRHMEQLALFALPMVEGDELEDDSAGGDKDDSDDSASTQAADDDETFERGQSGPEPERLESLLEDTLKAVEADGAENNKNQADELEEAKREVAEEAQILKEEAAKAKEPNMSPQHTKHYRATSCYTCRSRKIKCDETHPICERCRKGGRECVYPETNTSSKAREVIKKDAKSARQSGSQVWYCGWCNYGPHSTFNDWCANPSCGKRRDEYAAFENTRT